VRNPKDVVILVVDDEEGLRKAIVFDFKRKGYQVLEAGNGAEAFKIVQDTHVDVILSDVRMPGGDGIELLDKTKNLNPELPILMFITGFADLTLEEAYNKGADAVFSKPFDRKELLAAVMKATSTKEEIWSRKTERVDVDFKIELKLPALNIAIQGRVLNIGRGGIFVAIDDKLPVVGTEVAFKVDFNEGTPSKLEGSGIVRWIRPTSAENKPKGIGIEFQYLSDSSRQGIIELIQKLKTKAYIPS